MYSPQLLDHFQNPRNAGDVEGADATAQVENPVCGDVLRLTLKISAGRIAQIGFKAKGCVPSMACASALTELIAGTTVDEARALRREALIAAVGGLPQASTHAAQLALDVLAAALKQVNTYAMPTSHTPRRIACLQPSATVILDAIGELDRVVACTRYCSDVVPAVADGSRVILADSWTADTAQIVAAEPDLVIAAVPYQEKAVSEILRAGARFLGLAPKTLADIFTDIATIAGAVGAIDRGENVITAMRSHIEALRARTVRRARPRVFCEEWGKPVITSQKWVAELVEAAGGDFVGTPGQQVAPEEIASLDPEVIIAAWCGAGDRVPLEKIIRDRSWHATTAAVSGRVFCIRDEFLNTPAPTLLQGLDALAFAIHPEIFPDTKGIRRITDVPASTVSNSLP